MTFPAYPDYRDSGVEWLGVVPEHWGVKPLRYLGRFRKGLTITKADLTDIGIPCLNYGEVHSLYPFEVNQDIQALKCVPAEYLETEPSSYISYGDFVFADTSEDLEGVGNFTHVSGLEPLFAGYHTIIYSLDSDVSSRFLAYCLESFAFRTQLRMGVKGVKVFSVTQEILRGGIAWIPTTAEQTQIARFLDHETARIDALIKEQKRLIGLLKEKRQAVISHAVTKGLDPTVLTKDSGVEWLGEVPAHWVISQLKFNTSEMQTGPFGSQLHAEDYVDGGVPLINPAHMIDGKISPDPQISVDEVTWQRLKRHALAAGDIIFARRGELGRCAIVTKEQEGWLCGTGSLKAQLNTQLIAEYAYLLITSKGAVAELSLESKGSTMENLNTETLGRIKLPLPPVSEQSAILEYIHEVSGQFGALVETAESGINLITERRSALISATVTGKIDVRGWQPPVNVSSSELAQEAV